MPGQPGPGGLPGFKGERGTAGLRGLDGLPGTSGAPGKFNSSIHCNTFITSKILLQFPAKAKLSMVSNLMPSGLSESHNTVSVSLSIHNS